MIVVCEIIYKLLDYLLLLNSLAATVAMMKVFVLKTLDLTALKFSNWYLQALALVYLLEYFVRSKQAYSGHLFHVLSIKCGIFQRTSVMPSFYNFTCTFIKSYVFYLGILI